MANEEPIQCMVLFRDADFHFIAIYQLIPAISARLIPDLMGKIIYFGVAIIIGVFLFNANCPRP